MKIYKIYLNASYKNPGKEYVSGKYLTLFVYSDSHIAAEIIAMQVLDDAMDPDVEYEVYSCSTYRVIPGDGNASDLEKLTIKDYEQLFTKGYVEIK